MSFKGPNKAWADNPLFLFFIVHFLGSATTLDPWIYCAHYAVEPGSIDRSSTGTTHSLMGF